MIKQVNKRYDFVICGCCFFVRCIHCNYCYVKPIFLYCRAAAHVGICARIQVLHVKFHIKHDHDGDVEGRKGMLVEIRTLTFHVCARGVESVSIKLTRRTHSMAVSILVFQFQSAGVCVPARRTERERDRWGPTLLNWVFVKGQTVHR